MSEEMRLREIVGSTVIVPPSQLQFYNGYENEFNSNNIEWNNTTTNYCTVSPINKDVSLMNQDNNFNNNINDKQTTNYLQSPDDSLGDYKGQSSSSLEGSPIGEEYQCFSQEEISDSDFSEEPRHIITGGITNPNYPGFQQFATDLQTDIDSSDDEFNCNINNLNNNNNEDNQTESVNNLDSVELLQKDFYDKPKFLIPQCEECAYRFCKIDKSYTDSGVSTDNEVDNEIPWIKYPTEDIVESVTYPISSKCETILLKDSPSPVVETNIPFDNITFTAVYETDSKEISSIEEKEKDETKTMDLNEVLPKFVKNDDFEKLLEKCKDVPVDKRYEVCKKDKTEINSNVKNKSSFSRSNVNDNIYSKDLRTRDRRSLPYVKDKKSAVSGGFDVFNIETAMPKIDLEAIESHLKAAKEEERRRCNDREEIRRRLAMGNDTDEFYCNERTGRKPSLQARLQSGMNLQICFMNETISDNESPNSDSELNKEANNTSELSDKTVKRPATLPVQPSQYGSSPPNQKRLSKSKLTLPLKKFNDPRPFSNSTDFYACQAQLQAEARVALAQAKDMARMQMEIERQRQKKSPITEMVRASLEKVGITFAEDRRRLSRQILTEMNVAQLQIIVNDLHSQIELLNESLVKFLIDRDDLHMEQDSMLVDIEDLTRYLGAKDDSLNLNSRNSHKTISSDLGKNKK